MLLVLLDECRAKGKRLKGVTFPHPSGRPDELTARKLLTDSIAHRLAILDGLLSGLATHLDLSCAQRFPVDSVRRLSEFKDIRNDFSHYQAMSEPGAALVCQDLREQLADAMLAFEVLAETELVVFDRAVTGKPNVARFELYNGNSQNKSYRERTLVSAALGKCLGLTAEQLGRPLFQCAGEVFDATPYLHSALTLKGHRRHIWMLKRVKASDLESKSPASARSARSTIPRRPWNPKCWTSYSSRMKTAIRDAAETLHKELSNLCGYRTVGIGKANGREALIVYTSARRKRAHGEIPSEWEGFPVVVRPMSTPVP